jgi:hypothetical protein
VKEPLGHLSLGSPPVAARQRQGHLPGRIQSIADFLVLRPGLLALVYVLAFLPLTLLLSSRTPLSSDEIFTVYTSRLSSVEEIWRALARASTCSRR